MLVPHLSKKHSVVSSRNPREAGTEGKLTGRQRLCHTRQPELTRDQNQKVRSLSVCADASLILSTAVSFFLSPLPSFLLFLSAHYVANPIHKAFYSKHTTVWGTHEWVLIPGLISWCQMTSLNLPSFWGAGKRPQTEKTLKRYPSVSLHIEPRSNKKAFSKGKREVLGSCLGT